MDISKLTYHKKEEATLKMREIPQVTPIHESSSESMIVDTSDVSSQYQKLDGVRDASLIFVISGGESTEKNFLKVLIEKRLRTLRVLFMSENSQGLQPYQMQDKWDVIQKDGKFTIENKEYHLDSMDKVFLLSDVDEFYEQLVKITKKQINQGQWIISNPCFEIWLYYCSCNNPTQDLACLEQLACSHRSQKMKALGNTLVRGGGWNAIRAFEKMVDGIEHSKEHYAIDENGIPVLYATQMHEMAQYLLETLNGNKNEYFEYIKQVETNRRKWQQSIDKIE